MSVQEEAEVKIVFAAFDVAKLSLFMQRATTNVSKNYSFRDSWNSFQNKNMINVLYIEKILK